MIARQPSHHQSSGVAAAPRGRFASPRARAAAQMRRRRQADSHAIDVRGERYLKRQKEAGNSSWLGLAARTLAVLALAGLALAAVLVVAFEPHRELHAALPEALRPFRPLPIRALNALNVAVRALLGVEMVELLDVEALLAATCASFVAEQGGAAPVADCDWGDKEWGSGWREGLGVLVHSLREEAALTLIGRFFATHRLGMILDQRLRLVAYWKSDAHRDAVLQAEVAPPLFVVGLPRTGTSFLHTLLSQDAENFRSPLNWMVVEPVPPLYGVITDAGGDIDAAGLDDAVVQTTVDEPPASADLRRERIARASENLRQFKSIAPGIDSQHAMSAFRPEECIVYLAHTFVGGWEFTTYFNLPSFTAWLRDRPDYSEAMRWHRQMLKHLGSSVHKQAEGGDSAKPWVLKTPYYTPMLADLVREYPDAKIVMTHRRPVQALTSLNALQSKLRSITSDDVSPPAIARELFGLWDGFAERALATRQAWADDNEEKNGGVVPGGGLVDIELTQLHTDPITTVQQIYNALNYTLSAPAEARMRGWLAQNGREKHGKNRYDRSWFGIASVEETLSRFDQHPPPRGEWQLVGQSSAAL